MKYNYIILISFLLLSCTNNKIKEVKEYSNFISKNNIKIAHVIKEFKAKDSPVSNKEEFTIYKQKVIKLISTLKPIFKSLDNYKIKGKKLLLIHKKFSKSRTEYINAWQNFINTLNYENFNSKKTDFLKQMDKVKNIQDEANNEFKNYCEGLGIKITIKKND